jgi:hypothetical protein
MQSISNSWNLFKESFGVLMHNKSLVFFPIVSAFFTGIATVLFLIPASLVIPLLGDDKSGGTGNILFYIMLFVFYLVTYTIIFFFNTALVGSVMQALSGGKASIGAGMSLAFSKLVVIIEYALIASTVGIILSLLRNKGGLLGKIVAFLGDLAWNVATFLVIPALAANNIGPVAAIKMSASLLRKTWGEQIIGGIGFGFFSFLAFFAIALVSAPIFLLGLSTKPASVPLMILGGAVFIFGLVALGIVNSTLGSIYKTVLYKFAADGSNPLNFDQKLLSGAFKQKGN